jgi:hypothetical protein
MSGNKSGFAKNLGDSKSEARSSPMMSKSMEKINKREHQIRESEAEL